MTATPTQASFAPAIPSTRLASRIAAKPGAVQPPGERRPRRRLVSETSRTEALPPLGRGCSPRSARAGTGSASGVEPEASSRSRAVCAMSTTETSPDAGRRGGEGDRDSRGRAPHRIAAVVPLVCSHVASRPRSPAWAAGFGRSWPRFVDRLAGRHRGASCEPRRAPAPPATEPHFVSGPASGTSRPTAPPAARGASGRRSSSRERRRRGARRPRPARSSDRGQSKCRLKICP